MKDPSVLSASLRKDHGFGGDVGQLLLDQLRASMQFVRIWPPVSLNAFELSDGVAD